MKKVFSISPLVLYLLPTPQLVELLEITVLFENYQQPKSWDKEITFFKFFYDHYSESMSGIKDKGLDLKFPFKSH